MLYKIPQAKATYAYNIPGIPNLIQFLSQTLQSPVKTTLLRAIKNNHLITWPGIIIENVQKYISHTPAIDKGHLKQQGQNCSTKTMEKLLPH